MNVVMLTNTFTPHVGGVARSVESFTAQYRQMGHRVLVIAPEFPDQPADEVDVVRIPALQKFNGSDFSVRIPVPGLVDAALAEFKPQILHAHHPFLLGDTAVRLAATWNIPLVFTHHTLWERYTHYTPLDSPLMARFVTRLGTGYANLCDQVFAPSESIAGILRQRGVATPIEVVPTGVDLERFARGDGAAFRQRLGIPAGAYVIGHVGRLAPEKNLEFLAEAVARVMRKNRAARFLVVGSGPSDAEIRKAFARYHMEDRLHLAGSQGGQALVDAYRAMDVFAFASLTETQGMVLAEAMAAGVPVVAIDAPGAREVVQDGVNGRLVSRENMKEYARALAEVVGASPERRRELREAARQRADVFSMPHCAAKALAAYERLIALSPRPKHVDDSVWESALRWIESEWELWANLARSATGAWRTPALWRIPGWHRVVRAWRRAHRWIRSEDWGIRLLRLSVSEDTACEPGLILIQVDGLSRTQMERALARRRMPFLRHLRAREQYQTCTMYSGLPSSTPAVQGELFYGVRGAVPAFGFRDPETGRVVTMLDAGTSAQVESRLKTQGIGLLEGGSAYSNIYTGGAVENHFCASDLGWGRMLADARPLSRSLFALLHVGSVLRTIALMGLEFLLALGDMVRGVLAGRSLFKELTFVPARVFVSILMREFNTIGAAIDAARGLPVVQVNFLGYDEQSHRRGPSSAFAHWTLKGIDRSIYQIWRAARRSRRRDYQVWIYSDHGQELTRPYLRLTGKAFEDAVTEVFQQPVADADKSKRMTREGIETQRSEWLGGRALQKLVPRVGDARPMGTTHQLTVAAIGPLAHIYAPQELPAAHRRTIARRLVEQAHLPLVFTRDEHDALWAAAPHGDFRLPEQAAEVFGREHPFLPDVAEDTLRLCRHPLAGHFVVSGWNRSGVSLSFPLENGAHAGPGPEETRGFAFVPPGVPFPPCHDRDYVRPLSLRTAALHVLGRAPMLTGKRLCPLREEPDSLRIMTYNVHSCVGLDGRVSPARIARLIAQFDPDVVALQELDVRRLRTGQVDQAHEIARDLEMDFHFHPTLHLEEGHFGNAVLSRYPMRLVKAESLPRYGLALEPRGALWVEIEVGGVPLQVINTHLGLVAGERLAQIEMLLGAAWLGEAALRGPVVLCGDLNSSPRSPVYRRLGARLRDVQTGLVKHRPKRTFFSRYPLTRIDHVFVDRTIEVLKADVPRSELARRASDHLPVVVDLQLSKAVPAPPPLAAGNHAGNVVSQNGGLRSPATAETGEGITADGAEGRRE